jgi:hypothetical protein
MVLVQILLPQTRERADATSSAFAQTRQELVTSLTA